MNDRELLELAAKAAGVKRTIEWLGHHEYLPEWNPLENDAEAFRLAVKLQMEVIVHEVTGIAYVGSDAARPAINPIREPLGLDPYAATRRAIVRTAAALAEKP